jgi:hypothetical protein
MSTHRRSTWVCGAALAAAFGLAGCGGAATSEPEAKAPEAPAPEAPAPADTASSSDTPAAGAADAPSDSPEDPGAGDSRNTESIAEMVKAHRKEARDCYEKALKQVPGLKGDLVIHFTLTPAGKVKLAELNKERSTITEPSVVSCVIDVIRALEFPKSAKGLETTVNYPFNFNP